MQSKKANSNSAEHQQESIEHDHWGQPVIIHDDPATGAGERCECQLCGERLNIALVGGTDPQEAESDNWEEFYECGNCGASGSFRHAGSSRRWIGMVDYPEGSR